MSLTLKLKVIPSSSRDSIEGWLDDRLKIKVMAPPEKGKANKAVIKLLQKSLSLDKASITLESGSTSCHKSIVIECDDGAIMLDRIRQLTS